MAGKARPPLPVATVREHKLQNIRQRFEATQDSLPDGTHSEGSHTQKSKAALRPSTMFNLDVKKPSSGGSFGSTSEKAVTKVKSPINPRELPKEKNIVSKRTQLFETGGTSDVVNSTSPTKPFVTSPTVTSPVNSEARTSVLNNHSNVTRQKSPARSFGLSSVCRNLGDSSDVESESSVASSTYQPSARSSLTGIQSGSRRSSLSPRSSHLSGDPAEFTPSGGSPRSSRLYASPAVSQSSSQSPRNSTYGDLDVSKYSAISPRITSNHVSVAPKVLSPSRTSNATSNMFTFPKKETLCPSSATENSPNLGTITVPALAKKPAVPLSLRTSLVDNNATDTSSDLVKSPISPTTGVAHTYRLKGLTKPTSAKGYVSVFRKENARSSAELSVRQEIPVIKPPHTHRSLMLTRSAEGTRDKDILHSETRPRSETVQEKMRVNHVTTTQEEGEQKKHTREPLPNPMEVKTKQHKESNGTCTDKVKPMVKLKIEPWVEQPKPKPKAKPKDFEIRLRTRHNDPSSGSAELSLVARMKARFSDPTLCDNGTHKKTTKWDVFVPSSTSRNTFSPEREVEDTKPGRRANRVFAYDDVELVKSQTKLRYRYDGVVLLPLNPPDDDGEEEEEEEVVNVIGSPSSPDKPKKPPRTFAHDAYKKSQLDLSKEGAVQSATKKHDDDNPYEEISNFARKSNFLSKMNVPPPPPPRPRNKGSNPRASEPITKHNHSLPTSSFLRKKRLYNPNYAKKHSFIEIKEFRDRDGQMKRYKSDEFLYSEPANVIYSEVPQEPMYQDPADAILDGDRNNMVQIDHGVKMDEDGYAVPDMTLSRKLKIKNKRSNSTEKEPIFVVGEHFKKNPAALKHSGKRKMPAVRQKVSQAYSILRLKRSKPDHGENGNMSPANSSEDDDTDSMVDMEEHQRRMKYVSSVKEKHYATLDQAREMLRNIYPQLFEYAVIVGLKRPFVGAKNYSPYIKFHFPQVGSRIASIAEFCFPDAESWRPILRHDNESFSFVLTGMDGARKYGYCRRVLPPGLGHRLPEVFCIVSPLGASSFYEQLLLLLEAQQGVGEDQVEEIIKAAYGRPLPGPSKEVTIRFMNKYNAMEDIRLRRPADCRLEHVTFDCLLSSLSVDTLLKVFASVLLERRVIFTAQKLSVLSSCIHAIMALLYPFSWQHTFIPVLPSGLLDICCSPTPYIIGILPSCLHKLQDLPMEEVLIVDCDSSELMRYMGDEASIIPKKLQKALAAALKVDADSASSHNVVVFEAFLRLFVETVGHYSDCIATQQDSRRIFEKEKFCRGVASRSIRMFLEWFTETQMFEVFMTEKLDETEPQEGLFETRIRDYQDEMVETSNFKQNVRQLGRKVLNLGGKLRKAFTQTEETEV